MRATYLKYLTLLMLFAPFIFCAHADGVGHAARLSVKADLDKDADTKKKVHGKGSEKEMESSTKTETQTYKLEITVSNITSEPGTYRLEWYFIGRSADGGGKPFLCEKGSKELTLDGLAKTMHVVTSQPAESSETKNAGRSGGESGFEYKGYVVLVKHGDTILAKESNSNSFLKDEWLAKLDESPTSLSSSKKSKGGKGPSKSK